LVGKPEVPIHFSVEAKSLMHSASEPACLFSTTKTKFVRCSRARHSARRSGPPADASLKEETRSDVHARRIMGT
jgi:hypothetical protein